jgi:HAD superfamily hydrolase (TIGR01509 family)
LRGFQVFRFIIWDFDGTLIDAYPAFVESLGAAPESFRCHVAPTEIEALARQSLPACIATLCQRCGLEDEVLQAAFIAHYPALPPTAQPPFPGAVALCRRIQDAEGKNAIFTHRRYETLVQLLEAHRMADLFVALLTAEDHPRKPDPAAFLALMTHHGMSPAETLAVGDRALDIEAGQNAGVATCFFGEEIPAGLTPDYAVTSYADLEAILFP